MYFENDFSAIFDVVQSDGDSVRLENEARNRTVRRRNHSHVIIPVRSRYVIKLATLTKIQYQYRVKKYNKLRPLQALNL